jgi:hypothetical protein
VEIALQRIAAGEHHADCPALLPERLEDLAGAARHDGGVEHRNLDASAVRGDGGESLVAVAGAQDLVAGLCQQTLHQAQQLGLVLGDEHGRRGGRVHTRSIPPPVA